MTNNVLYFLSPKHTRSVMAEAWAERSRLQNWTFTSSGWEQIVRNPLSIKAMREVNIDLSTKPELPLQESLLQEASYIIAIYDFQHDSEPPLPYPYTEKLMKWDIPDPEKTGSTEMEKWAKYQEICDVLAENVKALEAKLHPHP